jgi:hypothetical protein
MSELTLETLDRDGALAEVLDRLPSASRRAFLRAAAVAGLASGAALLAFEEPVEAAAGDVAILNYALVLEYLQASFYTEAEMMRALHGPTARLAQIVGTHERAHVRALKGVLGRAALARPRFNFGGATEGMKAFTRTAVAFEDLGAAAYKGQAPYIKSDRVLAAALAIHSVEARHAAWIRRLAGVVPSAHAFDKPKSKPAVLNIVSATHFVQPATQASANPAFTG